MDAKSFEYNDKLDMRYRKVSNSLVVSGMGIIFFGLWSVIKVFAEVAFGELDLMGFLMSDLEDTPQMRTLMYAIFVAVILFVILLHYYIGRCAIQVGTGRRKRYFYLLLAAFLLYLDITGFEQYFASEIDVYGTQFDVTVASFLVDVANCATVLNLIISSIIYYSLKKIAGEE